MSNRHLYLWAFLFYLSTIQCSSTAEISTANETTLATHHIASVEPQVLPPSSIRGLTFNSTFETEAPPILPLESNHQLQLEFDELTTISGQFRAQVKHYNKNWTPSNLPDAWIIDGFNEFIITGGTPNSLSTPNYYHYKKNFKAKDLGLLVSGNFMLEVYDYSTNTLLFSLPFLVTEQVGKLNTSIETLFNSSSTNNHAHQIYNTYTYPSEIKFPQLELFFSYIPRHFLGLAKSTELKSIGNDRSIEFHLSRDQAFDASFDFALLDLDYLSINAYQIDEWIPETNPPRVILKPDQLNFISKNLSESEIESIGPLNTRNSRYTDVVFRLMSTATSDNSEIIVLGDFNNWNYEQGLRLRYNASTKYLEGSDLIKQGSYRYKYYRVIKKGVNTYLLPLNDSLQSESQVYHTVVYYRDPVKNFDRILIIGSAETDR